MKKLNNKGMTLMELLVSLALISIIMIFMYKLISNVRDEKKDTDKLTDNIIKINELVLNTENLYINKNLEEIKFIGQTIEFYDKDDGKVAALSYDSNEFNLKYSTGEKKWVLQEVEVSDVCYVTENDKAVNIKIYLSDKKGKISSIIEIPYYDYKGGNFLIDGGSECE